MTAADRHDVVGDKLGGDMTPLVQLRHELHQNPEIAYQEFETAKRIRAELDAIGLKWKGDLAGGTGTVAFLPRTREGGKCVALRADIDALPIHEETGKPYASKTPGRMHACGHDGHTTMLIGVARALAAEADRPNDVLFLFQPAEEYGAGASRMIADGALEGAGIGPAADIIFGLHGWPGLPLGAMCSRPGPMMASSDSFEILIGGQGGHAAMPHLGRDPIVAGAALVAALQTLVSRNVSPLESMVVTIGAFQAGSATNVIPMSACLLGTLRTLTPENRELGKRRIHEVLYGVMAAYGTTAEISWENPAYPATINDSGAYATFRRLIPESIEDLEPVMGAEDFSYYGQMIPACFFALGLLPVGMERYPNLHAPTFDFNDDAIPIGVEAFRRLALGA